MTDSDIQFEKNDGVAVVTLNRPQALNALTMGMVEALYATLSDWAADDSVRVVVIRGSGGRAFCAGGDVRAVCESRGQKGGLTETFFRTEYRMNRLIHHYPKPYVALMHGITMGGGVGVSVHGRYRVVTPQTMLAMPETGIGLFPDVGGSYFLPRCPGAIGMYLALTGVRLGAADCLYAGIADWQIPVETHDALIALMRRGDDPKAVLAAHGEAAGDSHLAANRSAIDRCFAQDSVEAIVAALEREGTDWAGQTLSEMAGKSPISQKLSFRQVREGASLDFDACMVMEYRLIQHVMQGHDFFEGVRALLIDKDKNPRWEPETLEAVSDATVEGYFESLGANDLTYEG